MDDERLILAKASVVIKPKPPKYVYKHTVGLTYYAKVKGVYLGTFPSAEAAAEAVAQVFKS